MKYKYIITDQTDPYVNLAFEQKLFSCCDTCTTILFFWQNDNTIVIGKNQDAFAECRVGEFIQSGGKIARRRSGGGAVFHDLGNLNYSIISHTDNSIAAAYHSIIIEALMQLGLKAEYNGKNDLLADGRKFSGNAIYCNGNTTCQHGTILINNDIEKMAYYLTPNAEKLQRNHVRSVSSRVVNLIELLPGINKDIIQKAIIDRTSAKMLDLDHDALTDYELISFFSDDNWIYGGKV